MEDNKIILIKITSWEANGYDDSDWDTIYYNVADKSILHNFGTTRGYTISSLPVNSEIISLENALSSGIVTEKEVRDAFAKDTFNSGKDIHAETARHVFHINEDEVPSPLRRKAKAVNFGIVYGISNWGLSKQINVSAKEADQIIQNFYDAYPEVASFLQQTIYDVQDNGFVKTMFGRKRYIREIFDSNYSVREFAKRAAMNAPIQGTAADLIKIAMIDVAKEIKNNNLKSKLVLQIHDELIFKVYDDEVDKLTNIVKNCMENAIKLDVKLEVDGGVAKTWYDAK